jgi:hypothetical protein
MMVSPPQRAASHRREKQGRRADPRGGDYGGRAPRRQLLSKLAAAMQAFVAADYGSAARLRRRHC